MHRLEVTYEGTPGSVPEARSAVEQALAAWGLDDLGWTAMLLVSELATNALLHGRTGFTVVLAVLPGGALRLEVSDGSRGVPRARRYGEEATTGRGLRLVQDLADAWGVERTDDGKTVWVELAAPARLHPADSAAAPDGADLLLARPDLDDGPVSARTT